MNHILIGFIFIFLDFNLDLGQIRIGFLPDFLGYIFLINGLTELAKESELFTKVKPYAIGMAIFTGIRYLMDLLGFDLSLGVLSYLLAIASVGISLYISYHIVMGIIEMENASQTFLNGSNLKSSWTLLAVLNVITMVIGLIPFLAVILIIATLVASVKFLFAFSKTKNLYYDNRYYTL